MNHPRQLIHLILLIVSITILSACDSKDRDSVVPEQVYPWQVEILPDGRSRVFGITLEATRLDEAAGILNRGYELGLFETPGQPLTLEAFFSEVTLGGLSGKIILTLAASQQELEAMRERAIKRKILESGARRYVMAASDKAAAGSRIVQALSYIPYVDLDPDIIQARFGPPAERIRVDATHEHWLYPDKGLDLLLEEDGKELLQYVVPARFEILRRPLQKAEGSSKTGGSGRCGCDV
jgi:hypothetical protein